MATGRSHGREREKDNKTLKSLLSREDEVSVDYNECPIKDSRGCCLYIQQHHRKSVKGQNGHEEKSTTFLTAVIAEQCETFTFFHLYPQKVVTYPSSSQDQLQVRMKSSLSLSRLCHRMKELLD